MQYFGNKALSKALLFALMFLGSVATTLQASVITSGCANTNASCTLDELVNGGSLIVDDILFDNWIINDFSTIAANLSVIEVLALDDQPLSAGLRFDANSALSVVGFDVIDLTLDFGVSTLGSSARINGNDLGINASTFDPANTGGFIKIWEDVLDVNGDITGEEFVTADNFTPLFNLYDSAIFTPQSQLVVQTTIFLSGDDLSDTVSLDSFTQRFSQVPEPSAFWLLTIGLVMLFVPNKSEN